MTKTIEQRKQVEQEFHDSLRKVHDDDHVADTRWSPELEVTIKNNPMWSNMKYYAVERKSRTIVLDWFKENCKGRQVLDYCCGNGDDGVFIAQHGAREVTGIDLSGTSIDNCSKKAHNLGLTNITFKVMDAEVLDFRDKTLDVVTEYGALHHVNLNKAYSEMARVLKPDGKAICVEALGHNNIIHLYRKLTPHLRTEWEAEHILRKKDIELARKYFNKIEIVGFFHLFTLGAVPFRNLPGFNTILRILEILDTVLLKMPIIKWQAWQVVYVLSKPKK